MAKKKIRPKEITKPREEEERATGDVAAIDGEPAAAKHRDHIDTMTPAAARRARRLSNSKHRPPPSPK